MKKYYIFDRGILDPQGIDNVVLRQCRAVKDTINNPLFGEGWWESPSLPWEVRYDNGYPNVIHDRAEGLFRCYYTVFSTDYDSANTPLEQRHLREYLPESTRITALCYAQSTDGVHWSKPALYKVDLSDGGNNNLLLHYAHGTGVMLDEEETDPRKRYKLVTKIEYPGHYSYMAVSWSANGLDWHEPVRWPRYNPAADSHNFLFRDRRDGKFKVITRIWQGGQRLAAICESSDFYNWSEPVEIMRGDGFESQIYSMPVLQHEGLYFGFPSIFHEGDRSAPDFDRVDCELAYTAHLNHFDRVAAGQPLIERGAGSYPNGEFDCGCIYTAAPIKLDDKLCFYYMGGNGQHTNFRETCLARAFLEKDRFAYYTQRDPDRPGVLPASHMHIYGERLALIADVESDGSISCAVCPNRRQPPYPGYDYDDCTITPQEDGTLSIRFKKAFSDLRDRPTCVMINFTNAKIYAVTGDLETESIRY
ncbi:MAG: hypothetical protein RSD74_01805 [Angelakisella sp.]